MLNNELQLVYKEIVDLYEYGNLLYRVGDTVELAKTLHQIRVLEDRFKDHKFADRDLYKLMQEFEYLYYRNIEGMVYAEIPIHMYVALDTVHRIRKRVKARYEEIVANA